MKKLYKRKSSCPPHYIPTQHAYKIHSFSLTTHHTIHNEFFFSRLKSFIYIPRFHLNMKKLDYLDKNYYLKKISTHYYYTFILYFTYKIIIPEKSEKNDQKKK